MKAEKLILPLGILALLLIVADKSIASPSGASPSGSSVNFASLVPVLGTSAVSVLTNVSNALLAAGMPANVLYFALSQVLYETAAFSSNLSTDDNNYSGIIFINDDTTQLNSYQGLPFPGSNSYYYAGFYSVKDWATDYMRVIELGTADPLQSSTVNDFATALKQNNYYTQDEPTYAAGMQHYYNLLTGV